ncbi:MAG: sortase [Clostridia bacterium]|nr:sortase [Clostridia bacterium]
MNSKYGDVLTVVLIVIVVAILGLAAVFGYNVYIEDKRESATQQALDEFTEATNTVIRKVSKTTDNTATSNSVLTEEDQQAMLENLIAQTTPVDVPVEEPQEKQEPEKTYLSGYEILGTIEIPKTGIKYPVLAEVTKKSLETSVAKLYGPGLNLVGNTVIVGHNYRNKLFFSKNNLLEIGDIVYITDVYGQKVTYEIYNKYYTSPNDAEYMVRDTEGRREISLSTCNDDSSQRLILWAKEVVQ